MTEQVDLDALELRAMRFQKLNPLHECFDSTTVLALVAELRQERERAENGSCWDDGPQMRTPGGCDPLPPKCELRAGHLGAHRGGGGEWMRNPASFNQVSKERDEARAALSRAEETIAAIRAARSNHPECDAHDDADPVTCGWKHAVQDMDAALAERDNQKESNRG